MTSLGLHRLIFAAYGLLGAVLAWALLAAARRGASGPVDWVRVPWIGPGFLLALAIGGWRGVTLWSWVGIVAVAVVAAQLAGDRRRAALVVALAAVALLVVSAGALRAAATLPVVASMLPAALLIDDLARRRPAVVVILLALISSAGLFLTLPDTELALLLGGLLLGRTLVAAGDGSARPSGAEAALFAVSLLWVVAVHGSARGTALVGGVGCLGMLALEPVAARLAPRFDEGAHAGTALVILHGAVVMVASRWAGMETDVPSALRVLGSTALAALLTQVAVWAILARRRHEPPDRR